MKKNQDIINAWRRKKYIFFYVLMLTFNLSIGQETKLITNTDKFCIHALGAINLYADFLMTGDEKIFNVGKSLLDLSKEDYLLLLTDKNFILGEDQKDLIQKVLNNMSDFKAQEIKNNEKLATDKVKITFNYHTKMLSKTGSAPIAVFLEIAKAKIEDLQAGKL